MKVEIQELGGKVIRTLEHELITIEDNGVQSIIKGYAARYGGILELVFELPRGFCYVLIEGQGDYNE